MRTEKFKVIEFIRQLIIAVDKELINFPKKENELKNRIRSNSYDILELIYEANSTENIDKKVDLLQKILAKVKVIDFLLNLSFDREIITSKKYLKLANRIDDITKFTTGWLNTIVKNKTWQYNFIFIGMFWNLNLAYHNNIYIDWGLVECGSLLRQLTTLTMCAMWTVTTLTWTTTTIATRTVCAR